MEKAEREHLHLRVPAHLKRLVEDFAYVRGLSLNAAATVLLNDGLRGGDALAEEFHKLRMKEREQIKTH